MIQEDARQTILTRGRCKCMLWIRPALAPPAAVGREASRHRRRRCCCFVADEWIIQRRDLGVSTDDAATRYKYK
jgi:hypothetical protein